ncbi:MAG: four helix bundle protein [Pseudobdellovibrionaceae bacterium]|nr:MAG: four helix bundle protein [Pseudobdellovibrionaceae bacterium]
MARYQHLPVYQLSYSFVRESYRLKAKLPKLLKYDLGSDISRSGFPLH